MLEQVKPVDIDEPIADVLTEGWLHKVMVVFHQATKAPGWVTGLLLLLLAAVAGWFWRGVGADTQTVWLLAGAQALFMAYDALLLTWLPRRGLSYGPWEAQVLPLALARLLGTLLAVVVGTQSLGWGVALFVIGQLVAAGALYWGTAVEPFRLSLSEIVMFSDRMALDAKPIRVLHISDLHVERLTRREEAVVALAEETRPDIIVITGDYVNLSYNRDPETARQVGELLSRLSAPYGVYATLGSPPVDLRETVVPIFEKLPIPLLRRSWARVEMDNGRNLILLGLDCTHHLPTDRNQLANLVAQAPDDAPQVLLFHSPEIMPEAVQHGIDLYLCGHTHGGQVRLPFIGPLLTSSQLGRRYVMGLYKEQRTHLYVSRGIGMEGLSAPRVRFKAPPEMTLITIRGKG